MKYIIAGIITFVVLFPVIVPIFPLGLNRIFELMGLVALYASSRKKWISPSLRIILRYFGVLYFIIFITSCINFNFDLDFFFFMLTPLSHFGVGFLIYRILGRKFNLASMCDIIILVQTLQAIISFIMFFNPSIAYMIESYIAFAAEGKVEEALEYRLVGIGNAFFGAAATYGVSLLLLCLVPFLKDSMVYRYKVVYWIIVTMMIAAGILSARTFMFVFLFIPLFFVMVKGNPIMLLIKNWKLIVVIPLLYFLSVSALSRFTDVDKYERMGKWAFEAFTSLEDSGEVNTSSTNRMKEMYATLPNDIISWTIGDAKFSEDDGSYYKHTDIGYNRHLFYWGILGLLCYLVILMIIYRITAKNFQSPIISNFLLCLFLFELFLNFKGIIVLSYYWSAIFVCSVVEKQRRELFIKNDSSTILK